MKVFRSFEVNGVDSLQLQTEAEPGALGPGQVRIKLKAGSINYRDWMTVSGQLGKPGPAGIIPCSDGAGEVIEVAADVHRTKVGDRVVMPFNPDWVGGEWTPSAAAMGRGSIAVPGTMAEQCVVHQSEVVKLPDNISYQQAAVLPCAGVTAWHALCGPAPLYPGMSVLLQGAGGVSVLGLQFAKLFGARVIMTTSSVARAEQLKQLGADHVLNYRENPNWHEQVRELTGGMGVDVAIDIGGADTIDKSMACARVGGRLAMVGLLTGWPESSQKLFSAGLNIHTVKVGSREDLERMLRAMTHSGMQPVIDRTFAFEQLPEALHYLKSGQQFGKIVIEF